MNWNALEWDRAAEELTWERVTLRDITDLQTPSSLIHLLQNSLRFFCLCLFIYSHETLGIFLFPFLDAWPGWFTGIFGTSLYS